MKINTIKIFCLIFVIIFLTSCNKNNITILGDIDKTYTFKSPAQLRSICEINHIDEIILLSNDNIAVSVDIIALEKLVFDDANVASLNNVLPPTVNIKNLKSIILKRNTDYHAISFFDANEQLLTLNPSELIMNQYKNIGNSEKNEFKINKYQKKEKLDFVFSNLSDSLILINNKGTEVQINKTDYLKILNCQYGLSMFSDSIVVVWNNPPKNSIYQIYSNLLNSFKTHPVLAIFIDGLGNELLKNYQNFYTLNPKIKLFPMRSCYPPQTKYAYYIMGNGFHREIKNINKIFADLKKDQGLVIEEAKTYYTPGCELLLNLDENKNGSCDDEIYFSAKKTILSNNTNFLFVHFHSIDDMAHKFSPYHPKTTETIKNVLAYVEDLSELWQGKVILFSDHGLHTVERSDGSVYGTHGINVIEDMLAVEGYYEKN